MKHNIDKQEKYTIIRLEEEKLDATISPELKSIFVSLSTEENIANFIVDLSQVRYTDSSGLSAILIANRLCNDKEGTLVLAGVTEHVLKLIKISQLEKVLNILPTVAEAADLIFMNNLERDLLSEDE